MPDDRTHLSDVMSYLHHLSRVVLLCICFVSIGCTDSGIEAKLRTLTGNDYLGLSPEERSQMVADSLDRFTTWKIWERPDICGSLLNIDSLTKIFDESAKAAGDNLLMFSVAHISNEECIRREEVYK